VAAEDVVRLLVSCPDTRGIVAAISAFLFGRGANIVTADQHSTDIADGRFFLRMEFTLPVDRGELEAAFATDVAAEFVMDWRFEYPADRKRVAIFASREDHCLLDLLWRWRRDELPMDVVAVVSNHDLLRRDVETFGVPYHHVAEEAAQLALLAGRVDLVVLARYMQVLSGDFLERIGSPVINIHHSFLPAFVGGNPYRRAHDRGVKLIGATAHYATTDLDEGPIIEQDVERVSHRQNVLDLVRIGRDIERIVLARAVAAHLDDRVLVFENRTVVF
jgi:formyltetrahydrofolate deformylase